MENSLLTISDETPVSPGPLAPGLYIVATPIGNLGDITLRAIRTLEGVKLVACEDKRITSKLLRHLGLSVPMANYNDHSSAETRAWLLAQMRDKPVALVSDAGTPLISDPGYKLVREARAEGISITSLPGPSAAIMALTLSGLPTDRFLFAGFLPPKAKARRDALNDLAAMRATLVFYESGPRLADMLADAADSLGNREAAIGRELTKAYEECVTGTLAELAARYATQPPRGEIVVIVAPPSDEVAAPPRDAIAAELQALLGHLPPAKAAGELARKYDLDRKMLYKMAMELKSAGGAA